MLNLKLKQLKVGLKADPKDQKQKYLPPKLKSKKLKFKADAKHLKLEELANKS
jgi:hypothetical protein